MQIFVKLMQIFKISLKLKKISSMNSFLSFMENEVGAEDTDLFPNLEKTDLAYECHFDIN